MTGQTPALVLKSMGRMTSFRSKSRLLRITLLPGELLRIPKRTAHVRIISGNAWISAGGSDTILRPGERYSRSKRLRRPVIVVAMGSDKLFFELDQ